MPHSSTPHQKGRRAGSGPAGAAASVDADEIARFDALAETWWNAKGPMRPLHEMAPVRIAFVRDRAAAAFGRDARGAGSGGDRPFAGLTLLDIGCGGGLMAEPMARLGFAVTGVDASAKNLAVARRHAEQSGLAIEFSDEAVEALAAAGRQFDLVLNLEVVEHVANVDAFLAAAVATVKPGGMMVVSTLNRTARAFAVAIVGAEYVLGLLPRGTHDWRKFIHPSELAAAIRRTGAQVSELAGLTYSPFAGRWSITRDVGVNYFAVVRKQG